MLFSRAVGAVQCANILEYLIVRQILLKLSPVLCQYRYTALVFYSTYF